MWSFRPGRWHRAVEAGGRYRATSCVVRVAVNLKTGWLILGRWMMAPEFVVAVSAPVAAHGLPPSSGWSRRRWSLSRATEQRSRSSGPRSRPACCRRRRDGRCRPPTRVCSPPLLRRRSQPSGWRRRRPTSAVWCWSVWHRPTTSPTYASQAFTRRSRASATFRPSWAVCRRCRTESVLCGWAPIAEVEVIVGGPAMLKLPASSFQAGPLDQVEAVSKQAGGQRQAQLVQPISLDDVGQHRWAALGQHHVCTGFGQAVQGGGHGRIRLPKLFHADTGVFGLAYPIGRSVGAGHQHQSFRGVQQSSVVRKRQRSRQHGEQRVGGHAGVAAGRLQVLGQLDGPITLGSDGLGTHQHNVSQSPDRLKHDPVEWPTQFAASAVQGGFAIERADHIGQCPRAGTGTVPPFDAELVPHGQRRGFRVDAFQRWHGSTLAPERISWMVSNGVPSVTERGQSTPCGLGSGRPRVPSSVIPVGEFGRLNALGRKRYQRMGCLVAHSLKSPLWTTEALSTANPQNLGSTGPMARSLGWSERSLHGRSGRWWLASQPSVDNTWDEEKSLPARASGPMPGRCFGIPPLPPMQRSNPFDRDFG
ncbi:hypothetical protein BN381_80333 [Candidatus Microthrix parvicella RN1]|uniref:Uncharacterized protein n=1 Tax=Candidatus Neomicrothrix parvicella RN1 TaxID=1229780 RepID=R4Z526_9ACTN|nr:hypothetical protein BN381_80333 [Candidatus Microthrix parvicella RN1]